MNDSKTTSSNNITKSDSEKTKTDSSIEKNKKTVHDRPAIFIEDTKDSKFYNLSK